MIRIFEKKRSLFEEVVGYFDANESISAVVYKEVHPSIVHYENDTRKEGADTQIDGLLDALNMRLVSRPRTRAPGSIFFSYDFVMHGFSPDATYKGFAYLTEPPLLKDLAPSLDDLPDEPLSPLFRHIQGSWYLYITATD